MSCTIGNPLREGARVIVRTNIFPTDAITIDLDLTVAFLLSSVNEENVSTIADGSNIALGHLNVTAKADISLDSPG